MQKSVNKLMYYPLRTDIPCRRVLKSKARAADNANKKGAWHVKHTTSKMGAKRRTTRRSARNSTISKRTGKGTCAQDK